jgi:hypothetical protein
MAHSIGQGRRSSTAEQLADILRDCPDKTKMVSRVKMFPLPGAVRWLAFRAVPTPVAFD